MPEPAVTIEERSRSCSAAQHIGASWRRQNSQTRIQPRNMLRSPGPTNRRKAVRLHASDPVNTMDSTRRKRELLGPAPQCGHCDKLHASVGDLPVTDARSTDGRRWQHSREASEATSIGGRCREGRASSRMSSFDDGNLLARMQSYTAGRLDSKGGSQDLALLVRCLRRPCGPL
jgi:hypothetical protein